MSIGEISDLLWEKTKHAGVDAVLDAIHSHLIERALSETKGNKAKAAVLLHVGRTTLRAQIERLGRHQIKAKH